VYLSSQEKIQGYTPLPTRVFTYIHQVGNITNLNR
jgi:hypothetical protein